MDLDTILNIQQPPSLVSEWKEIVVSRVTAWSYKQSKIINHMNSLSRMQESINQSSLMLGKINPQPPQKSDKI